MKRLFFLSVASATMMLLSCGGNKQQAQGEETPETTEKENVILRDRTIYGICTDGTAMNTLEMTTDNGDTLTLSLTKAQEDGKVFGGLQVTDRVAVVADSARQNALLVINLNDWVMPDPIDGSAEIGIRIKEGGVAESIDQSVIVYRTWKIFNGELEIELMREGGGDEEELNRYEILTLSADTLAYRTLGKPRDETETFEYSRWKPKPKVDLHGLELEETSDEFNKI